MVVSDGEKKRRKKKEERNSLLLYSNRRRRRLTLKRQNFTNIIKKIPSTIVECLRQLILSHQVLFRNMSTFVPSSDQ